MPARDLTGGQVPGRKFPGTGTPLRAGLRRRFRRHADNQVGVQRLRPALLGGPLNSSFTGAGVARARSAANAENSFFQFRHSGGTARPRGARTAPRLLAGLPHSACSAEKFFVNTIAACDSRVIIDEQQLTPKCLETKKKSLFYWNRCPRFDERIPLLGTNPPPSVLHQGGTPSLCPGPALRRRGGGEFDRRQVPGGAVVIPPPAVSDYWWRTAASPAIGSVCCLAVEQTATRFSDRRLSECRQLQR